MTNQQILTKAIQKAIDGRWKPEFLAEPIVAGVSFEDYKTRVRFGSISNGETLAVEEVIFNHDFAKALWGEEDIYLVPTGLSSRFTLCVWKTEAEIEQDEDIPNDTEPLEDLPMWQHRLQQMVIADDPIKYLGENL